MSQLSFFDEKNQESDKLVQDKPLSVPYDYAHDIKQLFSAIEVQTRQIISNLIPSQINESFVYRIPIRGELEVSGFISPERVTGEAAWELGLSAMARFYKFDDQNPVGPYRVPGVMYVKNLRAIAPLIDELEQTKKELKAVTTKIENQYQRSQYIAQILPGVVILQVYRRIRYADMQLRRVVFSWNKSSSSSTIVKPEKVVELLNSDLKRAGSQMSLGSSDLLKNKINAEIDFVQSLGVFDTLKVIKPVAPHPRIIGFDALGSKEYAFSMPANLPILLPEQEGCVIRHLPDMDIRKRFSKEKSLKNKELIIPKHHVYLVREDSGF